MRPAFPRGRNGCTAVGGGETGSKEAGCADMRFAPAGPARFPPDIASPALTFAKAADGIAPEAGMLLQANAIWW